MTPLFVSYTCNKNGFTAFGWVICDEGQYVSDKQDIEDLAETIEQTCGYDPGTVTIINFRRLEARNMQ